MKNTRTPSASALMQEDAARLADFVLFTQRNCILNLSPALNKGKISYAQFFLLAYLAGEDGLSMSNIARMMGHSTAAATGMVDKLQEQGYLKRYTAAADRRKIMVRITEEGTALIEQMRGNIARDLARMMADRDNAERFNQAQNIIARRPSSAL